MFDRQAFARHLSRKKVPDFSGARRAEETGLSRAAHPRWSVGLCHPGQATGIVECRSRSASSEAGLGIGLALVKYLVEAHGGSVSVDSGELRTGTTVTIRLPVIAQPDSTDVHSDETCLRAPPRRILLVDDDTDAVDSLGLLLGLDGHLICTASSATEALVALQNFSPDVALIDLLMPEIDGYALAAELRSRPVLAQLKLVALTGDVSPGDRETAIREGFDHHLAKPVDMHKLTSILAIL